MTKQKIADLAPEDQIMRRARMARDKVLADHADEIEELRRRGAVFRPRFVLPTDRQLSMDLSTYLAAVERLVFRRALIPHQFGLTTFYLLPEDAP